MRKSGDAPFVLRQGDLHIVPVCHYQAEFAACVRDAFLHVEPDVVAVELPSTLAGAITEAVGRFPYLSIVFYQGSKGETWYYPIEPTDALMEGVRSGLERRIPVAFVDLDVDDYPLVFDPMPDSYVVHRLGLKPYWDAYDAAAKGGSRPGPTFQDERREMHMAWRLQGLLGEGKKILFVCGMAHVHSVLEKLQTPQAMPVGKAFREGVRIFNLHRDSIREVTAEMAFIIALYETARGDHAQPQRAAPLPGSLLSLEGRTRRSAPVGEDEPADEKPPGIGEVPAAEETPSQKLQKLLSLKLASLPPAQAASGSRAFLDEDAEPGDPARAFIEQLKGFGRPGKGAPGAKAGGLFKFRDSLDRREEIRWFLHHLAEKSPGKLRFDRQKVTLAFVRKCAEYYRENTGDEIKSWQIRTFMKFARNYALLTGRLLPDFFQLMVAARGVGDDNFAYEVWDLGSFYPWEDDTGRFQTVKISCEEVWIDGKKIHLRRRYPALRQKLTRIPGARKREERPGDWAKKFDQAKICSYPPEDVVIEAYGFYLKKKALLMLSEERARIEPFTTSILDGIDVRETIRNWHEGQLYVREFLKASGGAGSVVVVFDEDREDRRYPWKMTWLGEHNQESDMAFYATAAADMIVGPGVARAEYGGFLMTYPPMRLFDVWTDHFYATVARTKSEVLLCAAIEYSIEKHVVYVAKKPPRSWFKSLASRLGKKLVYIPIGQLSPVTVKKIRVFHVLSGHQVREFAKEYIW